MPVSLSWYGSIAPTSSRNISPSTPRSADMLAGRISHASTSAMANQPSALSQKLEERPVTGSAQNWRRLSS